MSKSGVFAHFRSKEELQLAAVDTAREIYDREVTEPGFEAPEGIARVYGLCEAFLSHLERGVFPGGCFFVSVASELDAKDGSVRDHVREVFAELVGNFAGVIARAQELGELDPAADPEQILFELDSYLLGANIAFVFFGDQTATDRARAAIRDRLERLAP
jgi:AcrR family transcriptional regulator